MLGSSAWGSGIRKRSPQSIWHWSPVGLEGRSTQDWRKQRLHPWRGQTRFCMHLVPGQSSDFSGIWTWPISGSRRVSWWGRSHCFQVSRTPEAETPRNNHWPELSRRSPLWTWPHRRAYRLQCWEASGQTTNRLGTQPHLSADRLPKVIWDTQPPLNIPLNTALLTKRTRPTNQGAGTSPSHQEACIKTLYHLHPPGGRHQKLKKLQPCSLQKETTNTAN